MITLDVRDYCQNCPDFHPHTEKSWIYNKVMTSITCEDCVKCEKMYNYIRKEAGGEKNG